MPDENQICPSWTVQLSSMLRSASLERRGNLPGPGRAHGFRQARQGRRILLPPYIHGAAPVGQHDHFVGLAAGTAKQALIGSPPPRSSGRSDRNRPSATGPVRRRSRCPPELQNVHHHGGQRQGSGPSSARRSRTDAVPGSAHVRQNTPIQVGDVEGGSEDRGFEGHGSDGTLKKNRAHRPGLQQIPEGLLADRSLGLVGGFLGGIGGGSNSLLARFLWRRQLLPWRQPRHPLAASLVASTPLYRLPLVASTASLPASLAAPAASLAASAACWQPLQPSGRLPWRHRRPARAQERAPALPSWNRRRDQRQSGWRSRERVFIGRSPAGK